MKLDRGFKIKSSNPTAEMPKISFSCGLDIKRQSSIEDCRLFFMSKK